MITSVPNNYFTKADSQRDCSLGNILFVIAGIIGVAERRGYKWGFKPWVNQQYFVNTLPSLDDTPLSPFDLPRNYQGFDVGYHDIFIPDNSMINGYFGSVKYWAHCEDKVKFYLKMKDIADPYDDTILIHYRNNKLEAWYQNGPKYFQKAVTLFPKGLRVVVVTDNIAEAKKAVGLNCEYVSNSPIVDFYLISHTKYLIMSPSSNSFMAAYLSGAQTVVPANWYAGSFKDCPAEENYLPQWTRI